MNAVWTANPDDELAVFRWQTRQSMSCTGVLDVTQNPKIKGRVASEPCLDFGNSAQACADVGTGLHCSTMQKNDGRENQPNVKPGSESDVPDHLLMRHEIYPWQLAVQDRASPNHPHRTMALQSSPAAIQRPDGNG